MSEFSEWPAMFPAEVEVVGVQLPGRQDRVANKPFTSVGPLVATLVQVMRPLLDLPVALFGHSGGALLAFELARALEKRGEATVAAVFPSGQGAPHLPPPPPIHDLPEAEFRQSLRRLGGTAAAVCDDPKLMSFLGPTLRADFRLWERYRYRDGAALTAPVLAFGGTEDDRAPVDAVRAWADHTTGPFELRMFPGGHFFLDSFSGDVAAVVGDAVLRAT